MNLKISRGRPWVVMTFFFMVSFIMGIFTINLLSLLILVPMYVSIAKKANLPAYHPLNYAYIIGVLYCGVMGSCALPFSSYVIVMLNAFSLSTGALVDLGRYTFVVFPMTIALVAAYILICKYVFRIDVSALRDIDVAGQRLTVSKSQKWSLFMIVAVLVVLTLSNVLPKTMWLGKFLSTMGYGGISIGTLAIMMLIKVEGEPLLDFKKTAKGISWDVIMLTAFLMPLASLLGADHVGIKACVSDVVQPLVGNMSPLVLVIFIVLATGIITNFLNNMVVAVIFISVVSTMTGNLGDINLMCVAVLIILASSCAFVLPSGNPVTAFAFSYHDLVKTKDLIKFSFIVFVILMIIICTLGYVYLSALM